LIPNFEPKTAFGNLSIGCLGKFVLCSLASPEEREKKQQTKKKREKERVTISFVIYKIYKNLIF